MWCTVQESKRSRRVSWLTSSLTWWGHIFCKDAWIQSNLNQTKLWALKWVERRRLCTDYQVLFTRHLWHDLNLIQSYNRHDFYWFFVCLLKNPDLSRKRKKSHDDGPPAKRSKSEVEGEVQQMLTLQANQYKSEIIYQAHSKKVYCTCKVYQFMNIRVLNPKVLGLIHYTSHW